MRIDFIRVFYTLVPTYTARTLTVADFNVQIGKCILHPKRKTTQPKGASATRCRAPREQHNTTAPSTIKTALPAGVIFGATEDQVGTRKPNTSAGQLQGVFSPIVSFSPTILLQQHPDADRKKT